MELILLLTISYLSYAAGNERLFKEKVEARNEWNKKAQIGSVSNEISKVVVGNENVIENFKEMLSIKKYVGYESRLYVAAESVISLGKYDVDSMFREIVNKIDGDNKNYYYARSFNNQIFIFLNKQKSHF